ncbi:DUF58 domain-containing protein [Actinocrispum sp. NPDC049592]|uniref:DUF58 domain-containing protein n=1 Tax=Actinocrispum sp. NPDC049592 TaxID=3154835 RepID=UPI003430866C
MNRVVKWLRSQRDTDRWRNTDAMYRAVVVGVALIAAGVVAHTITLVLFGAPLLLSAVIALPHLGEPKVRQPRMPRTMEPGKRVEIVFEIEPGEGVELTALRAPRGKTIGVGRVHLLPGNTKEIRTELSRTSWGEGVDLRPDRLFAGPDALRIYGPIVGTEGTRIVLPPVVALPTGPLPPRPSGLVGVHRSPRPGDSTELRDIRVFQPGDRLRRIDWRVTLSAAASTGVMTPHIRERHADADATLIIALDTRLDIGQDIGDWATPAIGLRDKGTLDTAVKAATSLAASYLRQGDRVGLADLGWPQLSLAPGSGPRHLLKLRHQLVLCTRAAEWTPKPTLRPQQAPAGALVMVLSPFLDNAMVDLTATIVRRGVRVLAIDLLPAQLKPEAKDPWGEVVLTIVRAEHAARLNTLREHGIAVVRWGDELPTALRNLARRRR